MGAQSASPLLAFYANYVYYRRISGSDKQNHLYQPTLLNLGKLEQEMPFIWVFQLNPINPSIEFFSEGYEKI